MKEQYRSAVRIWLYLGAILVIAMVVIGGITRLTHSGLSMVDWKPITGVLPPMNKADWMAEFDNYKKYPEYQKLNYDFTIEDFKSIFWWEFIHRILGRIIGVVFIVPYAFFLAKKAFNRTWNYRLLILFCLGGLQGVIGWYMVKSGLVDNPNVSHYRLAIHFMAALTVYAYIMWLILLMRNPGLRTSDLPIKRWTYLLFGLTVLQLIYGTFVAGLKAGLFFNTWPLMGDSLVSPLVGEGLNQRGLMAIFEDPSTIQLIHRMLPYLIAIPILIVWRKAVDAPGIKNAIKIVGVFWLIQSVLGVITLLMQVPVFMGVLHQLGGVLFLSGVVYLLFKQTVKNQALER